MRDLEDLTRHDILPDMHPAATPVPVSRLVALWIGVLALLAGGVFGAFFLAGEDEGSPEEATRRMFDAIADEDVLGVLAAFAPSERDPYRDNLPEMVKQLQRLGILSDDASLSKVNGVDLEFKDLRFSTKPVGDGVAMVNVDGGTVTHRVVPSQLPLGDFLKDLIGEDLPTEPDVGSDDVVTDDPDSEHVVTIKEDGRWYVSLHYSIAESWRAETGKPAPEFGHGLQARGESSPEKAVESMLRAGAALDARRAIELLPPDEGRVLHDYAPLFLDDAEQEAGQSGIKISISSLDLDAHRDGGHATVEVKRFALTFRSDEESGTMSFDGECLTLGGPDVPPNEGRYCPDDAEGPPIFTDIAGRLPTQGLVAVERSGEWYVSPTRTVLESFVGVLKALQRSDLEDLRDTFQGTEDPTRPA
jgi:hypothetical protein